MARNGAMSYWDGILQHRPGSGLVQGHQVSAGALDLLGVIEQVLIMLCHYGADVAGQCYPSTLDWASILPWFSLSPWFSWR